jgi:PAS domain S-box-containing protein
LENLVNPVYILSMVADACLSLDPAAYDAASVIAVFAALDDVYFFMKDRAGRFLAANPLQLKKLGLSTESELVGKSDHDFFPSYMTARYAEDDAWVIRTGRPILRRVEVVADPDGSVSWHVTTKFPLKDRSGKCVGIVGCMRDFERADSVWRPFRRMRAVKEFIGEHFGEGITVADLAAVAHLSVSQFERRFKQVFDERPARFLIHYRLTRASQLLVHSDFSISEVAQRVGFYDHSHFTREFKALFAMPPGRYRQRHRARPDDGLLERNTLRLSDIKLNRRS